MRELTGEMLCIGTTSGPTLCVGARNRNAHGRLTRAVLCENLQQNAVPQRVYPDLTLALNTYRKNPCVNTLFGK